MVVNIGKKIKERAKELRIGPTELARRIDTSKQNIHGIYKRVSINTELLYKLCLALEFDFFKYYSKGEKKKFEDRRIEEKVKALTEEVQLLQKDLKEVKEKYALQKKLNEMLESKISNS